MSRANFYYIPISKEDLDKFFLLKDRKQKIEKLMSQRPCYLIEQIPPFLLKNLFIEVTVDNKPALEQAKSKDEKVHSGDGIPKKVSYRLGGLFSNKQNSINAGGVILEEIATSLEECFEKMANSVCDNVKHLSI